ncbi:MAG: AraC family transcriptional regulator [Alistipes sp.]|nr:AraC family transcriptional regulator [Alistipes sp.]
MRHFLENIDFNLGELPDDNIVIGEDLAIISSNSKNFNFQEPRKLTHAVIGVCAAGSGHFKVNLQEYELESPMLITLMPGQIIEPMNTSPNFRGYCIILSKRFIDMVNITGWQQQYVTMYNNPVISLDNETLHNLRIFYTMLYHAASHTDNPFRLQVIENLVRVFYYGGVSAFGRKSESSVAYKNGIVERFMELVQENYREERLISFYADKLCITPKYLSKLIKEHTGRSAGDWIENHVILEARAMLQTSEMTIQQIAAMLNFPNQSFFGKYFKRATGLSPKQYRNNKHS